MLVTLRSLRVKKGQLTTQFIKIALIIIRTSESDHHNIQISTSCSTFLKVAILQPKFINS